MPDYGAVYTDKEIAKLDKEIQSIYKEAEKDIQKKMDDFNAKYKVKEAKYQQKVASGQMTQEDFDRWKKGQVFQGKQWQAKKDEILSIIHNSNAVATNMINGESIHVFAANANYMSYDLEHGEGVNFGFALYDSNTVTNLIKDNPQILPKWKIDKPKDYVWSQKKLNRSITQGIIQGESLEKIANRLSDKLASTNKNKMRTFARTAMTGAQNSGRQTQLQSAKKLGIECVKEWMATLDSHTRDTHKDIDGEQVEVDKKFSNGLSYPGEPGGAPAEVYNCFIPETNIASDSEIIRSYKHYYSGKIVSIKSAGGINFSCTPNHPILTNRGWIAAGSLNNGDHLIVTFRKNNIFARINPNINHRLTRMDTIHEFFDKFGAKRTCSLGVNFHGDIPTSDVEIITKKRFLRNIRNICLIKSINKFLLKFTNTALMCESSFMEHFRGIVRSSFSNIGSISKPFSFIDRGLCHSNIHRFRSVPNMNIRLPEYPINNLPTNSNFFGEPLTGLTGKIFLDDIISIDVSDFTGHVYNLQTKNNYYFVNNNTNNTKSYNGIFAIAHNCRCTMVSDIKKYPSIYNRYDNETRTRIRNMSYREWEKAKKQGGDLAPYSVNKIALGNLFAGLSQNGAYTKIHDIDVKLSNQFYKELQTMGKAYSGGAKPAQVWSDYLNDSLPDEVSADKLESIMKQYKDKASKTLVKAKETLPPVSPPKSTPAKIDYSEFGGEEAFNILAKYKDLDDFYAHASTNEAILIGKAFKGKSDQITNSLFTKVKAAKNGVSGSVKAAKTDSAVKSIPKAKNAVKGAYKSTEEWITAAKNNPDVNGMLEIEEKMFGKFTSDQVDALVTYTGSSYDPMNMYLRYLGAGMDERTARTKSGANSYLVDQIDLCKKALEGAKLDRDMVLRRGTDVGDIAGLFMKGNFSDNCDTLRGKTAKELNDMFQGEAGTYFGFTSTSSQWDRGFSGGVEVIINAPKGSQAASIMKISQYGTNEGETLLNANTKVRCDKIEKSDGHFGSKIRMFLTILN